MAKRFLMVAMASALLVAGVGCGGTDDESIFQPTPTQGPPTPTPLPLCDGLDVPSGLGCRAFAWRQPESSTTSPSQLFTTLPGNPAGTFDFLPAMAPNGLDPGGNFIDLPPGLALIADGFPDPVTGEVGVKIDVLEENQREPGYFIIGVKPILHYVCLKIELESVEGTLYCAGSTTEGVDTRVTAAAGETDPADDAIELGLGDSSPPGSLLLKFRQQQARIQQANDPRYGRCFELPDCQPGELSDCYRAVQEVAFTTGRAFGMKGTTPLLDASGMEGMPGEPFNCNTWTTPGGPGRIVQGLVEFDRDIGNVATALRLSE